MNSFSHCWGKLVRAKTESASLYSPKKRKNMPVAMRTAARVLAGAWLAIYQRPGFSRLPAWHGNSGVRERAPQGRISVAADAVAAGVLLQGVEFAGQVVHPPLQQVADGEHAQEFALVVHNGQVAVVLLDHGGQGLSG